jgi:dihydrofolate reductase
MILAAPDGLVRDDTDERREDIVGKLVVTEFITLDGVIEDPGGAEEFDRGGWAFQFERGDEGDKFKLDELMASDAQLFGRVTYEGFAKAWPTREGPFADKINTAPKFVVSSTLRDPEWSNTTVIERDVAAEVGKLKERFDGDILVAGSAQLVRSLLADDLVDELHLMVFPVVLGSGKKLLDDGAQSLPFTLTRTRQTGQVAILELERARA